MKYYIPVIEDARPTVTNRFGKCGVYHYYFLNEAEWRIIGNVKLSGPIFDLNETDKKYLTETISSAIIKANKKLSKTIKGATHIAHESYKVNTSVDYYGYIVLNEDYEIEQYKRLNSKD